MWCRQRTRNGAGDGVWTRDGTRYGGSSSRMYSTRMYRVRLEWICHGAAAAGHAGHAGERLTGRQRTINNQRYSLLLFALLQSE